MSRHTFRALALAALSSLLFLSGCLWRVGVNGKHFSHPGGATTIDTTALRLDGYYVWTVTYPDASQSAVPMVLWKDGTAALSHARYELHKPLRLVHAAILDDLSRMTGERRSPNHIEWGGFRVYGDSISIQIMELSGKPRSWDPISYNGHIRDDTTIVIIERVEPWTTMGLGRKSRKIDPPRTFHFHPLEPGQKPASDNWTKEHEDLQ